MQNNRQTVTGCVEFTGDKIGQSRASFKIGLCGGTWVADSSASES